jgi:DNA-binding beta-propeller fold protein YncE
MSSRPLSVAFPSFTIETFAGTGVAGYGGDGGDAKQALLNQPFGVVVGPDKDIYFCDTFNHVIRCISKTTGTITTVVGNGKAGYAGDGGVAVEAALNEPYELRFDVVGNLYWVERANHVVRKRDVGTGKVSTIAGMGQAGFSGDGGPATSAALCHPHSIQFDQARENLLICDIGNHRIRAVSLMTGIISTWCGNGTTEATLEGVRIGENVPLQGPRALDLAPNGDLWLVLREGNAVYRIDAHTHRLEHVAGTGKPGFTGNGGPAKEATLSGPKGMAISVDGRFVFLADTESHTVRAIDLAQSPPTLVLIAGDGQKGDGPDSPSPLKCRMARLHGLATDPETGELYIGDSETHKVRVVRFAQKAVSKEHSGYTNAI